MVCIKDVQVVMQTSINNRWRVREEFESPETLESNANSATRRTTIVECEPGLFRFVVSLTRNFKWSDKANALRINLTFDQGDPITDHEVVILKPGDENNVQELSLETLKSNDAGELSFCLEAICMPLKVEDPSSPWLKAGFAFGRYSKDPASFGRNAPSSASKGNLRVDIVQCTIKRNPRRNDRFALAPKLDSNWRSLPPADNVTLKPEYLIDKHREGKHANRACRLRFDPSRVCNAYCHYKCKPVPGIQHVSFIFLYRELGHYVRIEKEDIDIVEDEVTSTSKAGRGLKKKLHTPKSDSISTHRSPCPTTIEGSPAAPEHSTESTPGTSAVPRYQKIQPLHPDNLTPSIVSSDLDPNRLPYDVGDGRFLGDGGLISLLETTTELLPQIEQMRQKGDEAEQAFVRENLQRAVDEMTKAQIALEKCKSEVDKWRDEDKKITKRLQNNSHQGSEDEFEKEERKIHGEAVEAVQKLHDARCQRLEMRKRRVSQWSTAPSSPSRETKRAR